MKTRTLFITVASVIALSSTAMADDHLFNAQQHGLLNNLHSQGFANGDKAPGQGSPFSGADKHIHRRQPRLRTRMCSKNVVSILQILNASCRDRTLISGQV